MILLAKHFGCCCPIFAVEPTFCSQQFTVRLDAKLLQPQSPQPSPRFTHAMTCGNRVELRLCLGSGRLSSAHRFFPPQLPAVLTPGVTLVVCPLLSLMQDQVRALCSAPACGGIPATFLSSQQGRTEAVAVLRELNKARPTCKLLYVTPEQLVKSSALNDILRRLNENGMLARVVIDEASKPTGQGNIYECLRQPQYCTYYMWVERMGARIAGAAGDRREGVAGQATRCCLISILFPIFQLLSMIFPATFGVCQRLGFVTQASCQLFMYKLAAHRRRTVCPPGATNFNPKLKPNLKINVLLLRKSTACPPESPANKYS